jgi:hypothetical protein
MCMSENDTFPGVINFIVDGQTIICWYMFMYMCA